MSRTYRRKNAREEYYWVLREYNSDYGYNDDGTWYYQSWYSYHSEDSDEGRKRLSHYHSDAGTFKHKEPGPSWFRNFYSQRPLRRHGKRELKKFLLDPEYEPIIEAKPPLPYWT